MRNPVRTLILGYIGVILVGALGLWLPVSRTGPLSLIDALFTSTSALCVTGLIVKDTGVFFTPFGKLVLAVLIEIGGLSYMTFATLFLFLVGKKGSLVVRRTMAASYPDLSMGEVYAFARKIVFITLVLELLGTFLLLPSFASRFGLLSGLGHAAFTSVSAFCNAGFSTFSTNLLQWAGDPVVNFTVMGLVVLGGLGFIGLDEYFHRYISRKRRKLTLHSRMVGLMTIVLIIAGFIAFLWAEWDGVLKSMPVAQKALASLFMSITPRTAGFNTVDYASLSVFSLLITMTLMLLGGSPGGTAGGLKTTTVASVFLRLGATLRGKTEVSALGYRIPPEALRKSFAALVLSGITLAGAMLVLSLTDPVKISNQGFLPFMFEVFSAFGTVGLSTGSSSVANASLSADLSLLGKSVIIITMLIGRIGVLSMFISFVKPERDLVRHVEGKLVVG